MRGISWVAEDLLVCLEGLWLMKLVSLLVENYDEARKQKIWRLRVVYWLNEPTRVQANTCARAPTPTHTQ